MLHVDLDNILTHDELASKADEALRKADDEGKILVITRHGRPAVAMLKLEHLEELSGRTVSPATPPNELPGPLESQHSEVEAKAAPEPEAPAAPVAEMPNPAGLPSMPE